RASRLALWRNELGHVNRLRVLNAHRGIEETVSGDDVAGGANVFKDTAVGENYRERCSTLRDAIPKASSLKS
ncbi:MAG TPA: hypothetical protein VLH78_00235, partial [Candidatus Nanoarchaeia archaeon]|nr:hypothetical protein [Candidatus Nanoarchaeia archaeon]